LQAPLSQLQAARTAEGKEMADTKAAPVKRERKEVKLTLPLLSMAHLSELTCLVMSEPYDFELPTDAARGKTAPAKVVNIVNELDSSDAILILSTVMLSAITKGDKKTSGRTFKFVSGQIRAGKKYRDVQVSEFI
jgi:hypothetical protein